MNLYDHLRDPAHKQFHYTKAKCFIGRYILQKYSITVITQPVKNILSIHKGINK